MALAKHPPTAAAAGDDAAVIEASAALAKALAEYEEAVATAAKGGPTAARLLELDMRENAALDILLHTPAVTPAGLEAKARALLCRAYHHEPTDEQVAALGCGLARDLLAAAAAEREAPPGRVFSRTAKLTVGQDVQDRRGRRAGCDGTGFSGFVRVGADRGAGGVRSTVSG